MPLVALRIYCTRGIVRTDTMKRVVVGTYLSAGLTCAMSRRTHLLCVRGTVHCEKGGRHEKTSSSNFSFGGLDSDFDFAYAEYGWSTGR